MIKDYLSYRNPNKKVLARCRGWSVVELPDHVDSNGVVHFRFAVGRTDEHGVSITDDGIIMSLDDLTMLPGLIESAELRESIPYRDYEAEHPKPAKPEFHLW